MEMGNLDYAAAHAFAYGYLSAEVRSAIRMLRRANEANDLADSLEGVVNRLDAEIEKRKSL